MSYLCRIKLGSVTNLSDARYAAAAGFDFIGFRFGREMPGYIPPVKAREIIDWTTGSNIIGEFGSQDITEIAAICDSLNIDIIEVDNDLSPEMLMQLAKPVIKKILVTDESQVELIRQLDRYHKCVDAFSVSDPHNLLYSRPDTLKELAGRYNLLLELNPGQDQLTAFLEQVKPYGISITGDDEEKAGIKDFEELDRIIGELSAED